MLLIESTTRGDGETWTKEAEINLSIIPHAMIQTVIEPLCSLICLERSSSQLNNFIVRAVLEGNEIVNISDYVARDRLPEMLREAIQKAAAKLP